MINFETIEKYVANGFWDKQRVKDAAAKGKITQSQMIEIFREYFSEDVSIENEIILYTRSTKLAELSNTCNETITGGFDVELSDGETYHFSLTAQDQLNLITLSSMIASGETNIPYHADGELCRLYSVEDIMTIIETATAFKTYNITYYNSLKAYIESLDDTDIISSIVYGTEIPLQYQSDILRSLLV